MSRKNAYLTKLRKQRQEYANECIVMAQTRMLDFVTIALGRLGWREKRFRQLDEKPTEVMNDYDELLLDDWKNDPDYVYSHAKIDQELQQYAGSFFKPFEERYGFK